MSEVQEWFRGFLVQPLSDEAFSAVVDFYNGSRWYCTGADSNGCYGDCARCLFSGIGPNETATTPTKRDVFRAYAETEKGYVLVGDKLVKRQDNQMPELKAGMLVRTQHTQNGYAVLTAPDKGYYLTVSLNCVVNLLYMDTIKREDVDAVYYSTKEGTPMAVNEMLRIIRCGKAFADTMVWERKKPVKLTVSQVSEKLGYPVEIVEG